MDDLTLPQGPLGTVTGILLILLGILALLVPQLIFSLLVIFFAAFAVIVSFDLIRSGLSTPEETAWTRSIQILAGILGILLGISILIAPYFIAVAAKTLFGIWAILTGAGNIISVFSGSSTLERSLDSVSGLVLVVVGVLLLFAPTLLSEFILVIAIGIFAIITGIFTLWLARAPPQGVLKVNHRIYK